MFNKQFQVPSNNQRKSQIDMFNFISKERRDSKEFLFPDENSLHRRRTSYNDINSASQSEDDDSGSFEVRIFMSLLHVLK